MYKVEELIQQQEPFMFDHGGQSYMIVYAKIDKHYRIFQNSKLILDSAPSISGCKQWLSIHFQVPTQGWKRGYYIYHTPDRKGIIYKDSDNVWRIEYKENVHKQQFSTRKSALDYLNYCAGFKLNPLSALG